MSNKSFQNILIIGASSAIAEDLAREFIKRESKQCRFALIARSSTKLEKVRADLIVRGAEITYTKAIDFNKFEEHETILTEAYKSLGTFDLVVLAHGSLTDQAKSNDSAAYTIEELNTNLVSFASFLTIIPQLMSKQKSGTIAIFSSVAGDRSRSALYTYGAAKSALDALSQGLRQRLFKQGIHVLNIKPGPIDTPMTASMARNLPFASTSVVAKDVYDAIKQGKDEIYTPWFWRYIMLLVKLVPNFLYKRI